MQQYKIKWKIEGTTTVNYDKSDLEDLSQKEVLEKIQEIQEEIIPENIDPFQDGILTVTVEPVNN